MVGMPPRYQDSDFCPVDMPQRYTTANFCLERKLYNLFKQYNLALLGKLPITNYYVILLFEKRRTRGTQIAVKFETVNNHFKLHSRVYGNLFPILNPISDTRTEIMKVCIKS